MTRSCNGRWLTTLITLTVLIAPWQVAAVAEPAAPPPPKKAGEYYVAGAERSGTYALTEGRITVRQALLRAGVPNRDGHLVLVRRDPVHGVNQTMIVPLRPFLDGERDIAVEFGDVLILTDERPAPSKERAAMYKVSGDVPNPGDFSLAGRRINLLQALVATGANPATIPEKRVTVRRTTDGEARVVHQSKAIELIFDRDGGIWLEPGDHVVVGDPSDAPAARP